MFKISKIIDTLRNRSYHGNIFNLRKFKISSEIDLNNNQSEFVPEPDQSNIPVQNESIPQSGSAVSLPSSGSFQKDLIDKIRIYLMENRNSIPEIDKWYKIVEHSKTQEPEVRVKMMDYISMTVDPALYQQIINNPIAKNQFIKIIQESPDFPISDEAHAIMFVEIMLAKTKVTVEDPSFQEWNDEYKEKEQNTKKIQNDQVNDPYSKSNFLQDPKLNIKAQNRLLNQNLSPEDLQSLSSIIGVDFKSLSPDQVYNALDKRLGPPNKTTHIDQRMNFFIKNPEYLNNVLSDSVFAQRFKEQLVAMGANPESDIISSIKEVSGAGKGAVKNRKRISNILNNEKATELYDVLEGLIETLNPAIIRWLKNYFNDVSTGKDLSINAPISDDGKDFSQFISDEDAKPRDMVKEKLNPAELIEASKEISVLIKEYLNDTLQDIENLKKQTVDKMLSDTSQNYIDIQTGMGEKGKKPKKKALETYNRAEQVSAYSSAVLEQLEDLFKVKGKTLQKDPTTLVYRNRYGQLYVPVNILKDIFATKQMDQLDLEEAQGRQNTKDYSEYVRNYKAGIDRGEISNPFNPDWKFMANAELAFKAYSGLSEIKEQIISLYKKMGNMTERDKIANISNTLNRNEVTKKLLDKFSNVSSEDQPGMSKNKIDDFIYMTTQQSASYLKSLKEGGSKRKSRKEEDDISLGKNVYGRDTYPFHNLKTDIGIYYPPLLGYISNVMDGDPETGIPPFSEESLNGFLDLFDTNDKVKSFGSTGRLPNNQDKENRRNTDLYYLIRGEQMPEGIGVLNKLYQEGTESSGKTHGGKPSIEKGSWYDNFFNLYKQYNIALKEVKKKNDKIQVQHDKKREKAQQYNSFAANTWGDPIKQENIINNFDAIIKKIKHDEDDSNYKKLSLKQFIEDMKVWDEIKPLPNDYYYSILGKAIGAQALKAFDTKANRIGEGAVNKQKITDWSIKELYTFIKEKKIELRQMGDEKGLDADNLSALRLAYVAYQKALNRIYKLNQIDRVMKYSSTNVSIIVDQIFKEFEKEFDYLFGY